MKFVRFLLFPFAILYDLITRIRNFLFDIDLLKSTSFYIPVIVVGNLSVGGTGKTPQIEYLIRLLKDSFKVAVLSRGYKRKTKGFVHLNNTNKAEDVGDEPLQYFKKFTNINVAVSENRVEGIRKLFAKEKPDIILLDDAYQHRKVKGSFYILLTKFDDLFVNDFLLPTGNLRESRKGANRADLILVTKCPKTLNNKQIKDIKNKLAYYNKQIFFTSISYSDSTFGHYNLNLNELKEYKVLLLTGIANPTPLLDFLIEKEIMFEHLKYPDHHNFSDKEIHQIKEKFNNLNSKNKIILTTEKDFTRLYDKLEKLSYLEIETCFLNQENLFFDKKVLNHIQQNRC